MGLCQACCDPLSYISTYWPLGGAVHGLDPLSKQKAHSELLMKPDNSISGQEIEWN